MLLIPPISFFRRRRQTPPAPPITGNRIVSVAHGGAFGDDAIVVTIHGTLSSIANYELAIEVSDGENWIAPLGGNIDGQPVVFFLFSKDVTDRTQWRVVHPEEWVFADGQPMEEPFEGEIG
jgi:hypothetical protein